MQDAGAFAECVTMSRRSLVVGASALALAACNGGPDTIVPDMVRPPLAGLKTHTGWEMPGFSLGLFRKKVSLLNVWASWCGYCRGEHSMLGTLEQKLGVPLYGLAYSDKAEAAAQYLRQAGNPFRAVAHDTGNELGRAIRQRGVPSTYVVGHDGMILAKVPGALSEESIERVLLAGVKAARQRHVAALRTG